MTAAGSAAAATLAATAGVVLVAVAGVVVVVADNGAAPGVTAVEAVDASEVPMLLDAVTVKV